MVTVGDAEGGGGGNVGSGGGDGGTTVGASYDGSTHGG